MKDKSKKLEESKSNNKVISHLKRFWHYLWYDDSFGSYIVNFIVAFIFIKFIFFPVVGFALNNDYPIVAIVSGSMEHKIVTHQICNDYILDANDQSLNTDDWWRYCGNYYVDNFNINRTTYDSFDYTNGLNIGDVMILYGKKPKDIQVGEILVFVPQNKEFFTQYGPVIHRVVKKWQTEDGKWHFQTKGDHNPTSFTGFENDITEDNVIGIAVVKIPFIGYVKIALNSILVGIAGIFH